MSTTSKKSVLAEERRVKCLEYRKAGLSYREIGQRLNIQHSAAYKHVKKALSRLREDVHEQAEDLRTLEMERADKLFFLAYKAALNGDLSAIDKAIRVMERRAKLCGLDEATRTEISGSITATPQWIELRGTLVKVLTAHPEAKRAVLEAIAPIEGEKEK